MHSAISREGRFSELDNYHCIEVLLCKKCRLQHLQDVFSLPTSYKIVALLLKEHFSKSRVGPYSFIVFAIGLEQLYSMEIAAFLLFNLCLFLLLPVSISYPDAERPH